MCGIFGYIGSKDAIDEALKGLKKVEYRGYDSAGLATVGDQGLLSFKEVGKLQS
jgi:Glucosamine 6-phosphate synthetase, contains amidotransferase and phosphosugar isomerase domains